jgi:hypothetical protein
MIAMRCAGSHNELNTTCNVQARYTTNRRLPHMKSIGLALTIFSLTGALAALDLSGAHRVRAATPAVAQIEPAAQLAGTVAADVFKADQQVVKTSVRMGPQRLDTFLVTPRTAAPITGIPVATLRYD